MKKSIWFIAFLMLASSFAIAQPGKGMGMAPGAMHMQMEKMDDGLKLTDDQQKALDKLALDLEKSTLALRNDLKAKQDELHLLMTQDSPNQKEIEKKLDEFKDLQLKMHKAMVDNKLAIRKLLNADQKVKWDKHLLKMEDCLGCGMGMGMGMGAGMQEKRMMKIRVKEEKED